MRCLLHSAGNVLGAFKANVQPLKTGTAKPAPTPAPTYAPTPAPSRLLVSIRKRIPTT